MTEDNEEAIIDIKKLEQVTYIQYSIIFPGSVIQDGSTLDLMLVLFDLGSKVNVIYLAFVERLGLVVQTTNVGA